MELDAIFADYDYENQVLAHVRKKELKTSENKFGKGILKATDLHAKPYEGYALDNNDITTFNGILAMYNKANHSNAVSLPFNYDSGVYATSDSVVKLKKPGFGVTVFVKDDKMVPAETAKQMIQDMSKWYRRTYESGGTHPSVRANMYHDDDYGYGFDAMSEADRSMYEILEHHGILGQLWGVRRYQNEDGSLTELGRRHYGIKEKKMDYDLKKEKLKNDRIKAKAAELEYKYKNNKVKADLAEEKLKLKNAQIKEHEKMQNARAKQHEDFLSRYDEMLLEKRNERKDSKEKNRNENPNSLLKTLSDSEARTLEYNDREADRVYKHLANRNTQIRENRRRNFKIAAGVAGGVVLAGVGGLALASYLDRNPEAKEKASNAIKNIVTKAPSIEKVQAEIMPDDFIPRTRANSQYHYGPGSSILGKGNYVPPVRTPLTVNRPLLGDSKMKHSVDIFEDDDDTDDMAGMSELAHVGVKFRSGRYPWGSGERPHQHIKDENGKLIKDPNGEYMYDEYLYEDGSLDWNKISDVTRQASDAMNETQKQYGTFKSFVDPSRKELPKKNYIPQAREMTDDELRAAINRMQMEQNYNRMMQEMNPSKRSESDRKLAKTLATAGTLIGVGASGAVLIANIAKTKSVLDNAKQAKENAKKQKIFNKYAADEMMRNTNFLKQINSDDIKERAVAALNANKYMKAMSENLTMDDDILRDWGLIK